MIAAWMLAAMLVAVLLGAAAFALEHTLCVTHRQARWVWVVALAGSLALPLIPWRPAFRFPPPAATTTVDLTAPVPVLGVPARRSVDLAALNRPLAALWVLSSLVLLGVLLRAQRGLRRTLASGSSRIVAGRAVRVTETFGPAVVGVFDAVIALPAWVLDLPAASRALVVRHEAEHLDRGDTRLLLAAALVLVAQPWNLGLWLQARRLRDAIELDCDRRLLRRGADVGAYGALLLEVARHTAPRTVPVAALHGRPSLLARRIDVMTATPSRGRVAHAAGAALLGLGLIALACETPIPEPTAELGSVAPSDSAAVREVRVTKASGNTRAPAPSGSVTPREVRVTEISGDTRVADVSTAYVRMGEVSGPTRLLSVPPVTYPPLLRQAGIEGPVVLEFTVLPSGRVDSASIRIVSSAHKAFERVAATMIRGARYTPLDAPLTIRQAVHFSLHPAQPTPSRTDPPATDSAG